MIHDENGSIDRFRVCVCDADDWLLFANVVFFSRMCARNAICARARAEHLLEA
jgi:hypothetical protein